MIHPIGEERMRKRKKRERREREGRGFGRLKIRKRVEYSLFSEVI